MTLRRSRVDDGRRTMKRRRRESRWRERKMETAPTEMTRKHCAMKHTHTQRAVPTI